MLNREHQVLEPFCLTWYQRKHFKILTKEYLEELGSEAKEEYNKALEELKEEQQK